jgi:hypothetical protein
VTVSAVETLRKLKCRGYTLAPKTLVVVHHHRLGPHSITYADKLLISGGPGPLDNSLREAVREHQPCLLAAACVQRPPIGWLRTLTDCYRAGKVSLAVLSANVAGFLGRYEKASDGLKFEAIVAEAFNHLTVRQEARPK